MKQAWIDFRMAIAFKLLGWAVSIMPFSDPQAQRLVREIHDALVGGYY